MLSEIMAKQISEKRLNAQIVLNNLSGYMLYDSEAYDLGKTESDICCEALKFWIESMKADEIEVI